MKCSLLFAILLFATIVLAKDANHALANESHGKQSRDVELNRFLQCMIDGLTLLLPPDDLQTSERSSRKHHVRSRTDLTYDIIKKNIISCTPPDDNDSSSDYELVSRIALRSEPVFSPTYPLNDKEKKRQGSIAEKHHKMRFHPATHNQQNQ